MRTDVKIAIAVAVFVILVVVIYVVATHDTAAPNLAPVPTAGGAGDGNRITSGGGAPGGVPTVSGTTGSGSGGSSGGDSGLPFVSTGTTGSPSGSGVTGSTGDSGVPAHTGDTAIVDAHLGGAYTGTPIVDSGLLGSTGHTGSGMSGTTGSGSAGGTGFTGTGVVAGKYTVQPGDSGFWGIAVKVYGNGRHMDLIAKANPDVHSNTLHSGQVLVVPPLPRTDTPAHTGSGTIPGGVSATLPPGAKTYVVKDGDGFWSISEKVYGSGIYHELISKANGGVSSLHPGQTLVIPAKPGDSSTTRPHAVAYGDPVAPGSHTATTSPSPVASRTAPRSHAPAAGGSPVPSGKPDFGSP